MIQMKYLDHLCGSFNLIAKPPRRNESYHYNVPFWQFSGFLSCGSKTPMDWFSTRDFLPTAQQCYERILNRTVHLSFEISRVSLPNVWMNGRQSMVEKGWKKSRKIKSLSWSVLSLIGTLSIKTLWVESVKNVVITSSMRSFPAFS
jgi:hypothetical protein